MTLLIFYLLLALLISFYCSLMEAVLLSVTPSYIHSKMAQKKAWAKRLFHYKSDIDRPLAAILSLNTIAHTIGAAGVGAQAALVFESISTGVVSAILTLLILVLSELIPKTLGASYWKKLARFVTGSLQVFLVILYPLILLSKGVTRLFRPEKEPSVERNEIVALADIGLQEGVLSREEATVLRNTINLRKLHVRDIMTPRMVMVVAHQDLTVQEFFNQDAFYRFSRIPVYRDNKDDIVGFVHKHDVFTRLGRQETDVPLRDILREIPVVPDSQSLYGLYSFLTEENNHLALVVEEFGGTAGLVTMEDLLETLLGMEIMDEYDDKADLREYARRRWKTRAKRLGIYAEEENPPSEASEERQ